MFERGDELIIAAQLGLRPTDINEWDRFDVLALESVLEVFHEDEPRSD